ncbi:hypothetical protein QL285_025905 [Trifolium repens]|nr:hypothetical protein QL285_025905 [Trifolium repens]
MNTNNDRVQQHQYPKLRPKYLPMSRWHANLKTQPHTKRITEPEQQNQHPAPPHTMAKQALSEPTAAMKPPPHHTIRSKLPKPSPYHITTETTTPDPLSTF